MSVTAFTAHRAEAQSAPDIRNVRPVVMLLVDTSGGMNRLPSSPSDDPAAPTPTPVCSGSLAGTNQRNRYTTLLEGLTGSWGSNFYCSSLDRRSNFGTSSDRDYYIPYFQPPVTEVAGEYVPIGQNNDGILDVYEDTIKFGLMTFDPIYSYPANGNSDNYNIHSAIFDRVRSNSSQGSFSFGGPRQLRFRGCPLTHLVDVGARSESADNGALISVGRPTDDHRLINTRIQQQLMRTRPYLGTPTDALLEDLRHYLNNHPDVTSAGDPFASCRQRYAILLTDGQPDSMFRASRGDSRFGCDTAGGICPYDLSSNVAGDLCRFTGSPTTGTCTGVLDGLFVVALDVNDRDARASLNDIAARGGTRAALPASDFPTLISRLSAVLDIVSPGTTTRSRPAFITSGDERTALPPGSRGGSENARQYQIRAGFRVPEIAGDTGVTIEGDPSEPASSQPWEGVLEQIRSECDDGGDLIEQSVTNSDRFHELLVNQRDSRNLYTALPATGESVSGNLEGTVVAFSRGSEPANVEPADVTRFDQTRASPGIRPVDLGLAASTSSSSPQYTELFDWVHGRTDSPREDTPLGDIYHSSPVISTPPRLDIDDEAYNAFRSEDRVRLRPSVMYVGSNDGILHAFWLEDNDETNVVFNGNRSRREIWGFVPPVLLPKMNSATNSHQIMLDATPVVREVFFSRRPGADPDPSQYHTVLISGFRGGAGGYFALDVTEPQRPPVFLWQHTQYSVDSRVGVFGESYGEPGIAQVLMDIDSGLETRAVAILPGGAGELTGSLDPAGCPWDGTGAPSITRNTSSTRPNGRCWRTTGRHLSIIDIASGRVLRQFDHRIVNAPLTGGVAVYPGRPGTTANRAFMTDADGVIWRLDMSDPDISEWRFEPIHDMFWNGGATEGQPAYIAPIVTTDEAENVVILQASGDVDRLDSSATNRIVSIREDRAILSGGSTSTQMTLNWDIRLPPGELVTGPLDLANGILYFATFRSNADASNACSMGSSQTWAVHYDQQSGTAPSGYTSPSGRFPDPGFTDATDPFGPPVNHTIGPYNNRVAFGSLLVQDAECNGGVGGMSTDAYLGSRYSGPPVGPATQRLITPTSGPEATSSTSGSTIGAEVRQISAPAPTINTAVGGWAGQADY